MASRITIYGTKGDKDTERLRREMRVLSMNYNFEDIKKNPAAIVRLAEQTDGSSVYPKVEVELSETDGFVVLANPDASTLRRTLFSESVFGITSYWI
jgi:hypothetical protein